MPEEKARRAPNPKVKTGCTTCKSVRKASFDPVCHVADCALISTIGGDMSNVMSKSLNVKDASRPVLSAKAFRRMAKRIRQLYEL